MSNTCTRSLNLMNGKTYGSEETQRAIDKAQKEEDSSQSRYDAILRENNITDESRAAWRKKIKDEGRTHQFTQHPELLQLAQQRETRDVTDEEWASAVEQYLPIVPIGAVTKVPTTKEMLLALATDKAKKGIVNHTKKKNYAFIPNNTKVKSRLDIPAYTDADTWIVSLKSNDGMSYAKTAYLTDVVFEYKQGHEKASIAIASGKKSKKPFATMDGHWKNYESGALAKMAAKNIKKAEWIEVGMNPYRHGYFYRKDTGEQVNTAAEVIQVGPLVLAKGIDGSSTMPATEREFKSSRSKDIIKRDVDYDTAPTPITAPTDPRQTDVQQTTTNIMNFVNRARANKEGINKTRKMLLNKAVAQKDKDKFTFVSPKRGTQTGSELSGTDVSLSAVRDADFSIETVLHKINAEDTVMMINRIFVAPEFRRMGIATDLYLAAIADAKSRGLDLVSDYSTRPAAMTVYGKLAKLASDKNLGFTVAMNSKSNLPNIPHTRKPDLEGYYGGVEEPNMRILID